MIKLNVRIIKDKECLLDYDIDVDSKEDFINIMSKGFRDNITFVINGNGISNLINPSHITAIQIKELEDEKTI